MIKNYSQLINSIEKVSMLKESLSLKDENDPISKASKLQTEALIEDMNKEISLYFEKGLKTTRKGVSLSDDTFKLFLFLARKFQKRRGISSRKMRIKKKIVKRELNNILRHYLDSQK